MSVDPAQPVKLSRLTLTNTLADDAPDQRVRVRRVVPGAAESWRAPVRRDRDRCGEWRLVRAEYLQPGVRGASGVLPRHCAARVPRPAIGPSSSAATARWPDRRRSRARRCQGRAGAGLDPCAALQIVARNSRRRIEAGRVRARPGCGRGGGREPGDTLRTTRRSSGVDRADRTVLGRHPRRRPGAHARRLVRSARESLAAVPGPQLPHLGAQRPLSARRRVRLPRSAAGRAGTAPLAPGSVPRAPAAGGVQTVRRRRCPALVASADRPRDTHALLGRSALAAVRRCRVRRTHRRRLGARRGGRVPRGPGARARAARDLFPAVSVRRTGDCVRPHVPRHRALAEVRRRTACR